MQGNHITVYEVYCIYVKLTIYLSFLPGGIYLYLYTNLSRQFLLTIKSAVCNSQVWNGP